ncbi:MAG TPA: hypothetical protein EYG90_04110 [Campylobacterales bacterium]|nr:hypothetical protein [Campylobacterales bacterium]
MKKIVLMGCLTLSSLLFAYEPSVYGAGNIESAEPYGLTQTERTVLENRKEVQFLKNMVSDQQSRIDGFTTIIEGLNQQIVHLKEQLNEFSKANTKDDYDKTYALLLDLGTMIDEIKNSYVTQDDLRMAMGGSVRNRVSNNSNMVASEGETTDISGVYMSAVQLFGRKSYNIARVKFEETLANNYKSASSNYYLGEIAYNTQDYSSAITYYKKSASLNDKANYMKVLYLHTAIALARDGQGEQARGFFQYVVDNYPGTRVADIAKKNL